MWQTPVGRGLREGGGGATIHSGCPQVGGLPQVPRAMHAKGRRADGSANPSGMPALFVEEENSLGAFRRR